MKKTTWIWRTLLGLCCALTIAALVVLSRLEVPETAYLAGKASDATCAFYPLQSQIMDVNQPLELLVWNIYKLQLEGWQQVLAQAQAQNQIVLLQEAQNNPQLTALAEQQKWFFDQAVGFEFNGNVAGVMTLSRFAPKKVCAFIETEPYLRLPKSSLYSQYPLSDGRTLHVVNMHSVNFVYELTAVERQIAQLTAELAKAPTSDPIIMAGDFNTWRQARIDNLSAALAPFKLAPVSLNPDERLRVFGYPLDHIFTRGLSQNNAGAHATTASDHAWLAASFKIDTAT